jgi:predicted RNA-binding Zn-ribbon protein involved in translation (DUF1610 family)
MCLKEREDKEVGVSEEDEKEEKHYCSVCDREISKEEYEAFDGMCWECGDDQLTEESEMMFGDVM